MKSMYSSESVPFNDLSRTAPDVMTRIKSAVSRVLDSGWYVMGPEHDAFEVELGEYLGVAEVIAVGNGTDALELALAAVGVEAFDTVLTVANAGAFATTATRLLGAVSTYCDVSEDSLLLAPESVRLWLSSAEILPRAIVVTHLYGAMAQVEEIVRIAREFGVAVVEDCAQSIGARVGGRQSGTFGDIATTSFYPTKNLGALGDGGAVFTNNPELANRVRRMRQYGWISKYRIGVDHGRNSRMDEIQAAVLRVKLPLLDSWNDRRREIHSRYASVAPIGAHLVHGSSESFTSHLAVLVCQDRDGVRASLKDAGIGTDVHYPLPDHKQAFPSGATGPLSLPVTERAARSVLSLPMFPELTDDEVSRVLEALRSL